MLDEERLHRTSTHKKPNFCVAEIRDWRFFEIFVTDWQNSRNFRDFIIFITGRHLVRKMRTSATFLSEIFKNMTEIALSCILSRTLRLSGKTEETSERKCYVINIKFRQN